MNVPLGYEMELKMLRNCSETALVKVYIMYPFILSFGILSRIIPNCN